jgi:zinc protease
LKRRIASFQDDFTGGSYQTLNAQLYQHSPYGRPINGYAQTLDHLNAPDVKRFWSEHFTQDRMVIAIAGDVELSHAMGIADKAFRDVPMHATVTARPPVETITKPRLEVIQKAGPAAQVMVGYLTPGVTRDNYPVYSVLDAIIGGGKRARLFTNIREKHSLGYQMGSFYQPLLFQSHEVAFVVTPPFRQNAKTELTEGLIDPVKGYLLAQLRELAESGPTDQELVRARNYVVGRYAVKQERSRDRAHQLAWNVSMGLGPDYDEIFAARVPMVTKEQVQAAAKGMLDHYALVITMPAAEESDTK